MKVKQRVVCGLRRLHLLSLADRVRFAHSVWRMRQANRAFRAAHPEVALPPRYLAYEAYGAVDWPRYLAEGRQYAEFFVTLIERYQPRSGLRVLDWGCGPGRVIRHLPDLLRHRQAEISGSDYNAASVDWCRKRLPGISFQLNGLEPPLAFPDASFDAVYSVSVSTHLSEEMHEAWRNELLRVLRPGGVLILTLHGDFFRDKLLPGEQARYDAGNLVCRTQVREGTRLFGAFHSPAFVRRQLLADLHIAEHVTDAGLASLRQDVWVALKSRLPRTAAATSPPAREAPHPGGAPSAR